MRASECAGNLKHLFVVRMVPYGKSRIILLNQLCPVLVVFGEILDVTLASLVEDGVIHDIPHRQGKLDHRARQPESLIVKALLDQQANGFTYTNCF